MRERQISSCMDGSCCSCSVTQSYLTLCDPMDWTAVCQASLYFTISQSLLKLMPIDSVMPSISSSVIPFSFCLPLLLLTSVFPRIRVVSNESALCIKWSKYWSFSIRISISNEYWNYWKNNSFDYTELS